MSPQIKQKLNTSSPSSQSSQKLYNLVYRELEIVVDEILTDKIIIQFLLENIVKKRFKRVIDFLYYKLIYHPYINPVTNPYYRNSQIIGESMLDIFLEKIEKNSHVN